MPKGKSIKGRKAEKFGKKKSVKENRRAVQTTLRPGKQSGDLQVNKRYRVLPFDGERRVQEREVEEKQEGRKGFKRRASLRKKTKEYEKDRKGE